jgi:hypothetical protein
MRRSILLAGLCLSLLFSAAQKTEWYARAGSGLFSFSGNSAVKEQGVVFMSREFFPIMNPYGKTPGFSITAGASMKKLIGKNWIWETALDFQSLSATSSVNSLQIISSSFSSFAFGEPATGTFSYRASFISVAPFLGKRIGKGKTTLDITAGPEAAFMIDSKEKVDYNSANTSGEMKRKTSPHALTVDIRIQLQAVLQIRKIGFFTGYARGFSNYYQRENTNQAKAFSNFVRFGMMYKLN